MKYGLAWRPSSEGWQVHCLACNGWHRVGAIHVDRRAKPTSFWTWAYDIEEDVYVKVPLTRSMAHEQWLVSPMSIMLLPAPDSEGAITVHRGRATFKF